MSRTNTTLVKGIIEVDESIDLTPFIDTASALVDAVCLTSGYSDSMLEMIERYLAAHCYTLIDPRQTSQRAGSVGESVQSSVDLGFDTSHYGQMAMRLDVKGNLAKLNEDAKKGNKIAVGITYLGTNRCRQS